MFRCFEEYIHIDFAPKDPKGDAFEAPVFGMLTNENYAIIRKNIFSPIDLAQSSLEPQVLMKEEAGMALLWRDLEAHSVAGFVHRLQLELHPQLFIISSDHVGDIFWRQVDQASIFVR